MRSRPAVLLGVTSLVTLAALTGCSVGFANGAATTTKASPTPTRTFGSSDDSSPGASPSASQDADSHQKPLTAVPSTCPDPAEVLVSLHVNLVSVDPNTIDDELECTYYNTSLQGQGVVILFAPNKGVSERDWATQFRAASPAAVPVAGVGDGAFYSVPPDTGGAINFYSGSVIGYIYIAGANATQADFAALVADQILVPD